MEQTIIYKTLEKGDKMALSGSINANREKFKEILRVDESFDLINRQLIVAGKECSLYFVDGLIKDEVMEKILEFFYGLTEKDFPETPTEFTKGFVPYVEVDAEFDEYKIVHNVLSGVSALLIDGFSCAIMLDTRTYPQRDTSEPEKDKVMRGSKDGFVETIIFNTALIRRRIRSPEFTIKPFVVGSLSGTDVAVCYMENKVDKKLLNKITSEISRIKVESLTMNQQSLIEAIYKHRWYNPFPKIKYTERPDTAASAILEGNIVILVDNSPSALLLPTSVFDIVEEADEYYFPPITGTYIKLTRYLVTIITLLLTPMWLLALQNPQMVPSAFRFILVEDNGNIPIFWQLILLELAIDGLRLASLNTPDFLTTALSVVGAIALSQFAIDAGWFAMESMLYMAFVAIANYTQPSYELGYSLKFMRIILLILTFAFNYLGFFIGLALIFVLLLTNRTISGKSYLYPLIPFNGKDFLKIFLRTQLKSKN